MAYKIKNSKTKEKEEDIFKVPKEEKEEETDTFRIAPEEKATEKDTLKIEDTKELLEGKSDSFQVEKQDIIDEIQQDLYSEDIPIEIQDESILLVKASGQIHKISRKDLAEYQRKYATTEEGSGFRELGTIQGDWRPVDTIATDVSWTFNKIDEKLGTYKTSNYDED